MTTTIPSARSTSGTDQSTEIETMSKSILIAVAHFVPCLGLILSAPSIRTGALDEKVAAVTCIGIIISQGAACLSSGVPWLFSSECAS